MNKERQIVALPLTNEIMQSAENKNQQIAQKLF